MCAKKTAICFDSNKCQNSSKIQQYSINSAIETIAVSLMTLHTMIVVSVLRESLNEPKSSCNY